jgi:hypothetical protein
VCSVCAEGDVVACGSRMCCTDWFATANPLVCVLHLGHLFHND